MRDIVADTKYLGSLSEQLSAPGKILVKSVKNGVPGRYPLDELSNEAMMDFVKGWVAQRVIPLRVVK